MPILTPKEKALLRCAVSKGSYRPDHETYCTLMDLVAYGLMEPDDDKPGQYKPTIDGEALIESLEAV